MVCAIVYVLPEPVTTSSVWWRRPRESPSTSLSMACGWSPVGSNGATRLKSGTLRSYHSDEAERERLFDAPGPRIGEGSGRLDPKVPRCGDDWGMPAAGTRDRQF